MKILRSIFVLAALASLGRALAVRDPLAAARDNTLASYHIVAPARTLTFVTVVRPNGWVGGKTPANLEGNSKPASGVVGESTVMGKKRLKHPRRLGRAAKADATVIKYVTETATEVITTQCSLAARTKDCQWVGTTTVLETEPPTTITSYTTATETATRAHGPGLNKQPEVLPPSTSASATTIRAILPPTTITSSKVVIETTIKSATPSSEPIGTTIVAKFNPSKTVSWYTTSAETSSELTGEPLTQTFTETSSVDSTTSCPKKRVSIVQTPVSKVLRQREAQGLYPVAPGSYGTAGEAAATESVTTTSEVTLTTTIVVVATPTPQSSPKDQETINNSITTPQQDNVTVKWIDDSSQTKNFFCREDITYHSWRGTTTVALLEDCKKLAEAVSAKDGYYTVENLRSAKEYAQLTQYSTCHVCVKELGGENNRYVEHVNPNKHSL